MLKHKIHRAGEPEVTSSTTPAQGLWWVLPFHGNFLVIFPTMSRWKSWTELNRMSTPRLWNRRIFIVRQKLSRASLNDAKLKYGVVRIAHCSINTAIFPSLKTNSIEENLCKADFFLFFVLLIFRAEKKRFETHTNKRLFNFDQLWTFERRLVEFYSQFRLSCDSSDDFEANFTIILARSDFKSTKRRSMKNIFTNTKTGSLSWSTAVWDVRRWWHSGILGQFQVWKSLKFDWNAWD